MRLKQSIICIYSQGGAYKQQQYYQHFPDPPDMSATVHSPLIFIYLVLRDFTPRKHAGSLCLLYNGRWQGEQPCSSYSNRGNE